MTKVLVVINGGVLQAVRSTSEDIEVELLDWDDPFDAESPYWKRLISEKIIVPNPTPRESWYTEDYIVNEENYPYGLW